MSGKPAPSSIITELAISIATAEFLGRFEYMASKTITAAQKRRMDIITREVGCIPCRMQFCRYMPAECNHLLKGYRIGHSAVVPECTWHHRGECLTGIDGRQMRRTFGPSRKLHKKQFRRIYGTDEQLLELTNKYVKGFEQKIIGGGKHEIQN